MPDKPISVLCFKPADRSVYYCQWLDPESGRKRTRSTGHKIQRKAEQYRGDLERELNAGVALAGRRTTWADFRKRVERDFLPEKRPLSRVSYATALNVVEETLSPLLVTAIDAEAIDRFKAALRARDVKDTTIASYLRMLKAVLRWGHKRRLIAAVPNFDMPRNVTIAGGRPITDAEFQTMLKAVAGVVGKRRAEAFKLFLRGLWASGLRISEAYLLSWDDPTLPRVDIDRPKPLLFIPGEHQKNGKDSVTPIVPEFLQVLQETKPEDRTGPVFKLPSEVRDARPKLDTIKRLVSDIGAAAAVEVNPATKATVTAHDLRRTFCHRWAQRVLPQVLTVLARHADIRTTLTYYAAADAMMTFDAIHEALAANKTANTPTAEVASAA